MKTFVVTVFVVLEATASYSAVLTETATPAFTWSGPYLGVDGGASSLNGDFASGTGATASEDFNGGLVGGFLGYNFQFDNVVLGVEGNLEYNWNDKGFSAANVGTDVAGAVRARVGYAFDSALIYGAAGWTATRGFVHLPGGDEEGKTFNGYTVGQASTIC